MSEKLEVGQVKFNLDFIFRSGDMLSFPKTTFENCISVNEARSWLNQCDKFINIGNKIINLNNVDFIEIEEIKESK